MSEPMAPKKSGIGALLTEPASIRKVLDGEKTTERRGRRHAEEGDTFELEGRTFVVTEVSQQRLGEMTDADARSEGVADMAAYRARLEAAHPGMPLAPQTKVWLHRWKER